MKRIQRLALSLTLVGSFAAGALIAPQAEAVPECFYDGCNWCCVRGDGTVYCTLRACPPDTP